MSATVNISNRQRRLAIDLNWVETMTQKLSQEVFRNLLSDPPEHVDAATLEEMRDRGSFSLVLVSNRQIQKLNNEWMGKNRPTDVLSFPLELEVPPSAELPWEVGEIVISLERAEEQAAEYEHSFERELAFLFVHGMLHVLGFDHMEADEEKEMFSRQKKILNKAGFKR